MTGTVGFWANQTVRLDPWMRLMLILQTGWLDGVCWTPAGLHTSITKTFLIGSKFLG